MIPSVTKVSYHDLGEDYLDKLNKEVIEKRLIKRLREISSKVTLKPAPQIA